MNTRFFAVCSLLLVTACLLASLPPTAYAKTQLMSGGIQEVDPQTLKELLSTFEQAEQAMQAHDIEAIMALYSENYLYHGLKKADLRKIWTQLFDHYKELESFHTFSVIRPAGSHATEMTCTGVVWGTSKETTLRAPIDSWYDEVHYLKRENGRWRIIGHLGGESQPVLQFGIAPHPLF
jgi:ketosteroid isomerase-like protein